MHPSDKAITILSDMKLCKTQTYANMLQFCCKNKYATWYGYRSITIQY